MKTAPTSSPLKSALLEHQGAIATTQASVQRLEAAIAEQEELINASKAKDPDVAKLRLERKEALASVALGLKAADGLGELDKAITKAEALLRTSGSVIKLAQETIEGLGRMVQAEHDKLQALQAQSVQLQRRFLLSEAEAEGAIYAALAVDLVQRFKRLQALGCMLAERGQTPRIEPLGPQMHIPCFALESNAPYADAMRPFAIFSAPLLQGDALGWARAEAQQLRAAGLEIE